MDSRFIGLSAFALVVATGAALAQGQVTSPHDHQGNDWQTVG